MNERGSLVEGRWIQSFFSPSGGEQTLNQNDNTHYMMIRSNRTGINDGIRDSRNVNKKAIQRSQ